MKRLALLPLTVLAATLAMPAAAQDNGPEPKVNQLIIYGDDKCPESTGDEITVCARLEESERYRIPESLRELEGPKNQSWANRVKSFEAVGDFGPLSCSPVGAGGELGCTAKMIEAAYEDKRANTNVHMAELIAKARAERLSTIDQQAAETQARVEAIEREQERLKSEGKSTPEATAQAVEKAQQ